MNKLNNDFWPLGPVRVLRLVQGSSRLQRWRPGLGTLGSRWSGSWAHRWAGCICVRGSAACLLDSKVYVVNRFAKTQHAHSFDFENTNLSESPEGRRTPRSRKNWADLWLSSSTHTQKKKIIPRTCNTPISCFSTQKHMRKENRCGANYHDTL